MKLIAHLPLLNGQSIHGLKIGNWTLQAPQKDLPKIFGKVALLVPRPNYSQPQVGNWVVYNTSGEILLSAEDYQVEEDFNYTDEEYDEAEELTKLRTLELLEDVKKVTSDGDCFISISSGGGSNAALFLVEWATDVICHDEEITLSGAWMLALDTGRNMALSEEIYHGSSKYKVNLLNSNRPPQWSDYEYIGSVPALRYAKTEEEAIRIVTLLREIEDAKEAVLYKGKCELWREGELAKCVPPPASCEQLTFSPSEGESLEVTLPDLEF